MSDYTTDYDTGTGLDLGDEYDIVAQFSDGQPGYGPVATYDDDDSGYDADSGYELDEDDDSELLDSLVDERVEAELAGLMAPNQAQQYWAEREARQAEQAEYEYAQAVAAVRPQLDALIAQAAQKYGANDKARLEDLANQYLEYGQYQARVTGWSEKDQASLASPQAVVNALAMAAQALYVRQVTDYGLSRI